MDNMAYSFVCPACKITVFPGCEASRYVNEIKMHGCCAAPCVRCGVAYCSHWPTCPKCAIEHYMGCSNTKITGQSQKESYGPSVTVDVDLIALLRCIPREITVSEQLPGCSNVGRLIPIGFYAHLLADELEYRSRSNG